MLARPACFVLLPACCVGLGPRHTVRRSFDVAIKMSWPYLVLSGMLQQLLRQFLLEGMGFYPERLLVMLDVAWRYACRCSPRLAAMLMHGPLEAHSAPGGPTPVLVVKPDDCLFSYDNILIIIIKGHSLQGAASNRRRTRKTQ